jgi:hypothetical protein
VDASGLRRRHERDIKAMKNIKSAAGLAVSAFGGDAGRQGFALALALALVSVNRKGPDSSQVGVLVLRGRQ